MSGEGDLRARLAAALGRTHIIERELGGGMSRPFVAREIALGRDVVVKIVAPELREELSAERFAREVQLAARLQQANIVPVLTAGDADGMAYYTMPYVDGESLRARIVAGPLPLAESVDVLRDVARALAYAHAQGIVHRDIKPENVLLSSGTAVVTDFGIAKALSASRTKADRPHATALTQTGTSIGTPAYMAPEQALGDEVDARSDLYAWGVIAYELLAGTHPFADHKTAHRLVAAHLSETPAPLSPNVPRDVAALVMQCLAKDPAERPSSANDVLARLSAAVTPRAQSVRGSSTARTRLVAAAVAVLALGTAGAMVALQRVSVSAPTIVVVPFDNRGDSADAYFAEGVSDEIAGQLARLPGLQVIGRDGVQLFRGSQRSPRAIARELGAAWVLSGTVRWARGASMKAGVDGEARVRIVPALVNVATGTQEWGEPSEERLTDVFKVQADVAERVASALSVKLGGAARATLRHQESGDPEARDAQLFGRYLLRQRGTENLRRAMTSFERAIVRDSSYARAWAGLSEASALLPAYYDTTETDEALFARAERAALKAVALDSTLPEVQLALARSYGVQFKFKAALHALDRALVLDPNATLAWTLKYEVLTALGRAVAADSAAARAVRLDGLSALALNNRAWSFAALGMVDSAVRYSRRSVDVAPTERQWLRSLGSLYAIAGRYDDGVRMCEAGVGFRNNCAAVLGLIAPVPARRDAGLAALGAFGRLPRTLGNPTWSAMAYAHVGMPDSMFARLAVAVDRRDDVFGHLITLPVFAKYQADPRWDAIVGAARRR